MVVFSSSSLEGSIHVYRNFAERVGCKNGLGSMSMRGLPSGYSILGIRSLVCSVMDKDKESSIRQHYLSMMILINIKYGLLKKERELAMKTPRKNIL